MSREEQERLLQNLLHKIGIFSKYMERDLSISCKNSDDSLCIPTKMTNGCVLKEEFRPKSSETHLKGLHALTDNE